MKTLNVGIYCRLSDEDEDKENPADESESIQNQKSMLIQYALNRGWCVHKIYCDENYSGADRTRPEFNQLLADCENGKINIVLCKSQSRFCRDIELTEKYIHGKFEEWGIRFLGLVDNADTSVKENKKARQINALTHEWYLEEISQSIRRTRKHKNEQGLFTGSHAKYGYLKDPKNKNRLMIDPVAAEVVKKMAELALSGYGYIKIAKYLNEQNIPTPYYHKIQMGEKLSTKFKFIPSEKWHPDTIRCILREEMYTGKMVQGRHRNASYKNPKSIAVPKEDWIIVANTHEPILDEETWIALQARLTKYKRPQKNTGKVQIFSGKVFCAECGKLFRKKSSTKKHGRLYEYLVCKGRSNGDPTCNNCKSIPFPELEEIVRGEMNALLETYYNQEMVASALKDQIFAVDKISLQIEALRTEQRQLEQIVLQNQGYFKTLYEDKAKGFITDEQFLALSKEFQRELTSKKKRMAFITKELDSLAVIKAEKENKESGYKKYRHIEKLTLDILSEFIERITIGCYNKDTNSRNIVIQWAL